VIACPVCALPSARPFLERDRVPVHQNLIVRDVGSAVALNRGRLSLHVCQSCGFVFNAAFDPALLSYGAEYDNTQSCSPAFGRYMQQLAERVVERGVRGTRIVEIGCGKGAFLRALVAADPGNTGIGFDPSYVGPADEDGGRIHFERRFYDRTCAELNPGAVVCRHVIEHIPDPVALLSVVRETLGDGSATVFFETPCVEWILAHNVIWDFFYEHCSYFTAGSLSVAFERAGFEVDAVSHTFGGQYLWIEARPRHRPSVSDPSAGSIPQLADRFAAAEAQQIAVLRQHIESLTADGPVAMWGAAAKGVTLANLVDPHRRLITCIVDVNPNKQGGYLPGSGHPIVAPADLPSGNIRTAIMTNPNYFEENAKLLREAALNVRLVDLMQIGEVDAHSH
jgi:hypothetical protein